MMKSFRTLGAVVLLAFAGLAAAQEKTYSEGPVLAVTSVKVMDGQFENYMKYLDTTYKATMEASKKAGLITDYSVFSASPRKADDADLYLVVTYPNMAALDGLDDRMEPVVQSVTKMNRLQSDAAAGKRTVMRTILGTELVRELKLK
jgi:hypothetical protein